MIQGISLESSGICTQKGQASQHTSHDTPRDPQEEVLRRQLEESSGSFRGEDAHSQGLGSRKY